MESNDSPEIPDRGETSDIPGLPSGGLNKTRQVKGSAIYTRQVKGSAMLQRLRTQYSTVKRIVH